MASIFPVYAILVIVLGLIAASWLATPKGPHQTYVPVPYHNRGDSSSGNLLLLLSTLETHFVASYMID